MLRSVFRMAWYIVPQSVKDEIIKGVTAMVARDLLNHWVETSVIPLDQKIVEIERRLERREKETTQLDGWLEKRVSAMEKRIEALNVILASKKLSCMPESAEGGSARLPLARSRNHEDVRSEDMLTGTEYRSLERKFHGTFDKFDSHYEELMLSYVGTARRILDIGCGTGTLLKAVKESKPEVDSFGVDSNEAVIAQAQDRGLNVVCGDALEAVESIKDDSYDVVFAIHIVEHLPFGYMRRLLAECYRVVAPGGRLIVETPNTQSVYVMSHHYYIDPSHQMPRHPSLYCFILELTGFRSIDIDFSGDPPTQLTIPRHGEVDANNVRDSFDERLHKISGLLFSAGNNVMIEASKD